MSRDLQHANTVRVPKEGELPAEEFVNMCFSEVRHSAARGPAGPVYPTLMPVPFPIWNFVRTWISSRTDIPMTAENAFYIGGGTDERDWMDGDLDAIMEEYYMLADVRDSDERAVTREKFPLYFREFDALRSPSGLVCGSVSGDGPRNTPAQAMLVTPGDVDFSTIRNGNGLENGELVVAHYGSGPWCQLGIFMVRHNGYYQNGRVSNTWSLSPIMRGKGIGRQQPAAYLNLYRYTGPLKVRAEYKVYSPGGESHAE